MSNSKTINELLSQVQTQIKNYKNKLTNKQVDTNNANVESNNDFLIEDGYIYDAPVDSELPAEYSNKMDDDQGSIKEYVLKCACHNVKTDSEVEVTPKVETVIGNTSIVVDGESTNGKIETVIGNTSIIEEPKVDTVIGNTSEIESQPKLTEKEKSFFG